MPTRVSRRFFIRSAIAVALSLTAFLSPAQSFTNVNTFTTQNGLSNNTIACLEKDDAGFLWIGTHEGLNRYDGTEFINILSNTGNNLPSNNIIKICKIDSSTLAIATEGGLCLLNTITLAGRTIQPQVPNPYNVLNYIAWDIYFDKKQKELWVGTVDALYVLSQTGILKRKLTPPKDNKRSVFARHILADPAGRIFIYTQKNNGGFFYPDFDANKLIPVEDKLPQFNLNRLLKSGYSIKGATCIGNKLTCCFAGPSMADKRNIIACYDDKHCFIDSFSARLTNNYFLSDAYPVSDSLLLVNSYFGEPFLYNINTKKIKPAAAQPLWFTSWPDGIYAKVLADGQNIWVATTKALLQLPQYQPIFKNNPAVVQRLNANKSLITYNYGIYLKNKLWLSCLGAGAFAVDTATAALTAVFSNHTPLRFKSKVISYELISAGSALWIFSVYGAAAIDPLTFKLSYITAAGKDSSFDDQASSPFTDSKGNIWVTLPNGVAKYTPAANAFTSYTSKYYGGTFPLTKALYKTEDQQGNIWFVKKDSLVKFTPATNTFSLTLLKINGASAGNADCLAGNGKDLLYMSINGSFAIYHIPTGAFRLFTKTTGIVSTSINQIITDTSGNPWMATEGGLVYYNQHENKFFSYTKADGLPDDNIISLNFADGQKQRIFLGFSKSYAIFNIQQLLNKAGTTNQNKITGVEVNGQAVAFNRHQQFAYTQNSISFFFTGINFTAGPQNSYAYMLQGFDNNWIYADKKRQCNYVNLPPGDYTFKIKSANQQGQWNEAPATFTFTIAAPFWQTWWFRIIIAALCIALIYAFVKQRDKNVAAKNKLQLQMSELRLQAVQSQMNPHFIFNSLNSIQNFIVQNNQIEAARYLSRFSKLIRRILDNSHHQFLKLDDIVDTLKMYVELEAFRFNKEFTYSFTIADDDQRIYDVALPPMLLQPYVENAILHGLMPKEGSKHLHLSFYIKNDNLYCIIEDNGIGRRPKQSGAHISHGHKLTKSMIQSMKLAHVDIQDLKDPHGNPAGTRVIIQAPVDS